MLNMGPLERKGKKKSYNSTHKMIYIIVVYYLPKTKYIY